MEHPHQGTTGKMQHHETPKTTAQDETPTENSRKAWSIAKIPFVMGKTRLLAGLSFFHLADNLSDWPVQ